MNWKTTAPITLGLLGFLAAAAFPEYTLRTAGTAEGGGISSAGQYDLTYTLGQPSPVGISANPDYNLTSGLVLMLPDVSPPIISHQAPQVVPALTELEIEALIGDDRTGVGSAAVFYREGGRSSFRNKDMQHLGGGLFSASLPPSAVTAKGLVYYIEAGDNAQNVSHHPPGAPDSVVCVRVYFEDFQSPGYMPAGSFRMISLPGSTSASPDSVLVDDFGAYDRAVWKLGRWNASEGCTAQCYDEYPDIEGLAPGRAFWLISRNSKPFDFSGLSADITRPFPVALAKGWNQIGTPFGFTTDWLSAEILFEAATYVLNEEHVVDGDTIYVEDNLISYDGVYRSYESALEPWAGYWIYNGSTQGVDLLLYPEVDKDLHIRKPHSEQQIDLLLAMMISSSDTLERVVLAGMSPQARDGWDTMDHREPPPIGDYFRLVFDHPYWGRHSGKYMCDMKRSNRDGVRWEIDAESPAPRPATIKLEPVFGMPPDWDVFIYDPDFGVKLAPGDLPYPFRLEAKRRFILLAGSEEFIRAEEQLGNVRLRPQIVAAAPNPFRRDVCVSLYVPRRGRMKVDLFSVEGRHVKVLADTFVEAGLHAVTWQGDLRPGESASAGIYFLRFETDQAVRTAKILKMN